MQDGRQGISHDRILMRIKDYIQIATAVGGFLYGGIQAVRAFDRMNQQVEILQQQSSAQQQQFAILQKVLQELIDGNHGKK